MNKDDLFARRLNESIADWERRHQRRLTNTELATRLARHGHSISKPYLSQLRTGRRKQPSAALLDALAQVLKVPADYFTHEDRTPAIAPEVLVTGLTNQGLRRLINTAIGLSPESLDNLSWIADQLRQIESLHGEDRISAWVP